MSSARKSSHIHIYKVGDCVEVSQRRVAIIKYIGKLKDTRGIWYGIEFIDGSVGSHNGVFKNTFYFTGAANHCEFIHKGDIRRKLKQKSNSTRNLHSKNNTLLTTMQLMSDNANDKPILPLNHITPDPPHLITLKLRCMCFADPIPIELKIDMNQETMLTLKQQIINHCNNSTNLPLFKSIIHSKNHSQAIDIYQLTPKLHNNHGKSTRLNLNVKAGNMAHCILKKNAQLFSKLTLENNHNIAENMHIDNVPLKYYKLKDNDALFVLFKFNIHIKIVFQKTLFVSDEVKQDHMHMTATLSDEKQYVHHIELNVNISDKFDKLYLKLMELTSIKNINSIKLLSNTFIYNKSMMIEKFVYNEIDENDGNNNELFLYFVHMHMYIVNKERSNHNFGHHKGRTLTRNYSLMSNYSMYNYNTFINHNSKKYTKVLLNFVQAKRSESYTIIEDDISIAEMRENICDKYGIECDKMKLNNNILMDTKLIREYNLKENDILHIFDESESDILIQISQSTLSGIDSLHKLFEIKVKKSLTIKHIKFEISKILRYPMISQTLIMKEVLNDNQEIINCGIKNGDTLRLVYNFGKRVKKLANEKIKIPIITFNTNKKFEVIVNKNIFIHQIMQIIQREKGIEIDKQLLLFHGIVLEKQQRLNYYNITHEMHLFINK